MTRTRFASVPSAPRWVAVVATVTLLAAGTGGCSNGGGADPEPGAASQTAEGKDGDGTASETPAVEPVMLGDQRSVSPCQVLPLAQLESIFGALPAGGYVSQELMDRGLSPAEMAERTDTLTQALYTRCAYSYVDADRRSVEILASQYASPKEAAAQWDEIRAYGAGEQSAKVIRKGAPQWIIDQTLEQEALTGGDPVKGLADVLYVRGKRQFVGAYGNTLIELKDAPGTLEFTPPPMSQAEYQRQIPGMRKAFATIAASFADPDLAQTPLPTTLGPDLEVAPGVPYLEPCQVLDTASFEAAAGRPDDGVAESRSLYRDPAARRAGGKSPADGAPYNECTRGTSWVPADEVDKEDNLHHATMTVQIRYAADGLAALDLMEDAFIRENFSQDYWDEYTLGMVSRAGLLTPLSSPAVDLGYIYDTTLKLGKVKSSRSTIFTVGPYAVYVTGEPDRHGPKLFQPSMTADQYAATVEALAANLRRLAGLPEPG